MEKKNLIFGSGKYAHIVKKNLDTFSSIKISNFLVDDKYLNSKPTDEIETILTSTLKKGSSNIFIGFTFEKKKGPEFLKKVVKQCLDKKCYFPGFNLSEQKIDIEIGDGVQIFKNVYYDPDCRVGSYTQIRPGVRLGHHVVIEKYCYIAPGAKIGGGSIIKEGCFIGQDAVLAPGTIINKNCLIGFASVIKKEIPENSLVVTQNKMIIKKFTDPFKFI